LVQRSEHNRSKGRLRSWALTTSAAGEYFLPPSLPSTRAEKGAKRCNSPSTSRGLDRNSQNPLLVCAPAGLKRVCLRPRRKAERPASVLKTLFWPMGSFRQCRHTGSTLKSRQKSRNKNIACTCMLNTKAKNPCRNRIRRPPLVRNCFRSPPFPEKKKIKTAAAALCAPRF